MNVTRYGNKSVIADIWDDDKMPRTEDGRQVDILLNLLAIINRTTAMPLYELFITGAGSQVRNKMKEMSTLKEKEKMLFTFIRILNEDQEDSMHKYYRSLSTKEKEAYIQDAIDNGILIHQTPLWESLPIFYRCQNLLKEFDFIKPDTCYIKKWGRDYKILSPYFIGDMYLLKLKQSDRRGFSARSTGALDNKSLPTRSNKNKSHQERISSSCIRFGEYETNNFSIAVNSEDIAAFHALYRTSIKGRKDLIRLMFSDDLGDEAINKIDDSYTSRVAEIFNVILKSLGISCNFVEEQEAIFISDERKIKNHVINGTVYFCTDYQAYLIKKYFDIQDAILEQNPIMLNSELYKQVEAEMLKLKFIDGTIQDELGGLIDNPDDSKTLYIINEDLADDMMKPVEENADSSTSDK